MTQEMIVDDILIEVLAGLIIFSVTGIAASMYRLHQCFKKSSRKINQINKAFAVVLKLMVIDTRKNHPDSEYIVEIDKIYKEIVEDSD